MKELDLTLYINERGELFSSKNVERQEQIDSELFIPANACVLELGGRYGLAAAVINNRLDDPTKHIVVEPDPSVQQALKKNRDSHNSYYTIFEGVISRKPMFFNQYGFCSFCSPVPNDTAVRTLTLEDLQKVYQIDKFTHLVADCEGGLIDFFEENKDFFETLEGVYFEADTKNNMKVEYTPFEEFLKEKGFHQKKGGFRQYWERLKLGSDKLAEYCTINAADLS